jgi:hypothetical protein
MPSWEAWVEKHSGVMKKLGSASILGWVWFDLGWECFAIDNICNQSKPL